MASAPSKSLRGWPAAMPLGTDMMAAPLITSALAPASDHASRSPNDITASNMVKGPSRLSRREPRSPPVRVSPHRSSTGPAMPPAAMMPSIRGQSPRRSGPSVLVGRTTRKRLKPRQEPRYSRPARSTGLISASSSVASGALAPNKAADARPQAAPARNLARFDGSIRVPSCHPYATAQSRASASGSPERRRTVRRGRHDWRDAIQVGQRASSPRYSTGSTTSVSSVDVTRPPMTTVASGRCTSAPWARRERHRNEADAGDERRHQHRAEPHLCALPYGLLERPALVAQLVDVATAARRR